MGEFERHLRRTRESYQLRYLNNLSISNQENKAVAGIDSRLAHHCYVFISDLFAPEVRTNCRSVSAAGLLQSVGRTFIDSAPLNSRLNIPSTIKYNGNSAMEAVGVALAVLPLLLNQLDNYVQGLETIKGFRAKRYRRELEGYFTNLGAQQTIFINYLLRSLDGVGLDYEDEIIDLSYNSLGALWSKESVQSNLKKRLGRNFDPFIQMMREISNMLDELSRMLGWDENASVEVCFMMNYPWMGNLLTNDYPSN